MADPPIDTLLMRKEKTGSGGSGSSGAPTMTNFPPGLSIVRYPRIGISAELAVQTSPHQLKNSCSEHTNEIQSSSMFFEYRFALCGSHEIRHSHLFGVGFFALGSRNSDDLRTKSFGEKERKMSQSTDSNDPHRFTGTSTFLFQRTEHCDPTAKHWCSKFTTQSIRDLDDEMTRYTSVIGISAIRF